MTQLTSLQKRLGQHFCRITCRLGLLGIGGRHRGDDDDCSSVGSFVGSFRVAFFVLDEFAGKSGFGGNWVLSSQSFQGANMGFLKKRIPSKGKVYVSVFSRKILSFLASRVLHSFFFRSCCCKFLTPFTTFFVILPSCH